MKGQLVAPNRGLLQDWAAECANQESGGRVKGMPLTITKRSVLVEVVCSIIFVCGPGHGAINFAQYENMAFTPNMPLAMYQDVQLMCDQTKDSKTPITDEQLMAVSPDNTYLAYALPSQPLLLSFCCFCH